jgi:hypothetical protein
MGYDTGGAGLKRCGKSCRLRYTNYLRPNLKHENFTQEEEDLIVTLHATFGSRYATLLSLSLSLNIFALFVMVVLY